MNRPQSFRIETFLGKVKAEKFLLRSRAFIAGPAAHEAIRERVPKALNESSAGRSTLFGIPYFVDAEFASDLVTAILSCPSS
jgi:hypothetical protein